MIVLAMSFSLVLSIAFGIVLAIGILSILPYLFTTTLVIFTSKTFWKLVLLILGLFLLLMAFLFREFAYLIGQLLGLFGALLIIYTIYWLGAKVNSRLENLRMFKWMHDPNVSWLWRAIRTGVGLPIIVVMLSFGILLLVGTIGYVVSLLK